MTEQGKIPPVAEHVDYERVQYWAKRGLTAAQIVCRLRLDGSILDTEAFEDAVAYWRAEGVSEVADALFDRVREGNLRAITFFLKAIGHWNESARARTADSGGSARWDGFLLSEEK